MLLNIPPVHVEGLNCREDIFFSVASHYRGEYRLAFSEAFNFEYLPLEPGGDGLMGERIGTGNNNIQALLEMHYGLKIITVKAKTVEEILDTIKEQLQLGYPTAISINTYWCPWSRNYQKHSFGHTCLALDIDVDNNIICIDPVSGLNHFQLPYADFEKGYAFYSTFHFKEFSGAFDYKSILAGSVEKIRQSNIFNNMENFVNDFKTRFSFENEFREARSDIWGALLYRNLIYVSGSRFLYSQFINHINKNIQNPGLDNIDNDLQNIYSKWKVSISWFLKGVYTNYSPVIHNKTLKIFEDILREERSVFNKLLYALDNMDSVQNKESVKNTGCDILSEEFKCTFIDLEDAFNNTAFYSVCSKECPADFTGTGQYFLTQEAPDGQIISLDKMCFQFPVLQDGICDNISCSSQIIPVPPGEYKGILILGSSEWGNYTEHMKLNHAGGYEVTIRINLSDWAARNPLFDEKVMWKGKVYDKNEGRLYYDLYSIFAILRPFPGTEKLESITLPECTNMHIFAITLCK